MKSRLTAAVASTTLLIAWTASASLASAGGVCAPHTVVVDRLAAAYGEKPKLRGTTKSDYTVEVFSSKDFATWTLTVRAEGGPTCLIASGRGRDRLDDHLAAHS
ncbi:MAG: hypothetical protein AAGK37_02220 [Pseudomonadota bacterium]